MIEPREVMRNAYRAIRREARVRLLRRGSPSFSNLDEESVIRGYLERIGTTGPGYCVDIAASDGTTMSNTYSLYREGWAGLAVEYDASLFAALARRYRTLPQVNLARCKVTPDNVRALLDANETPSEFELLNLDIDGYDFFVLDEILQAYRPRLLCVEVNEKIPPPIRFSVNWDPDYCWSTDHFYGQSIAQLDLLVQKYDYSLVQLHYNNAFLIPAELACGPSLSPAEAYRIGYLEQPDRKTKFPWNEDMEPVLALTPEDALTFVQEYFAPYDGMFTASL